MARRGQLLFRWLLTLHLFCCCPCCYSLLLTHHSLICWSSLLLSQLFTVLVHCNKFGSFLLQKYFYLYSSFFARCSILNWVLLSNFLPPVYQLLAFEPPSPLDRAQSSSSSLLLRLFPSEQLYS